MKRGSFHIYTITCVPTCKIYVGITSNGVRKRWSSHKATARGGSPTKLSRAIRKYGEESFVIEHVASCRSFDELLVAERIVISQYDSKKNGLNSTDGGDGVLGLEHTREARQNFSIRRKALWASPTYRENTSRRIKDGWHTRSGEEIESHRQRGRLSIGRNRRLRPKKEKLPRWKGKGWNMSSRTHCARGHEFSPENTRISKSGRICLICKRASSNVSRDRRLAETRLAAGGKKW